MTRCTSTHKEVADNGVTSVWDCELPAGHDRHRSYGIPEGNDMVWSDEPEARRERLLEVMEDLNVGGWIVVPHPGSGEPMQEQIRPEDLADALLDALGVPRG